MNLIAESNQGWTVLALFSYLQQQITDCQLKHKNNTQLLFFGKYSLSSGSNIYKYSAEI